MNYQKKNIKGQRSSFWRFERQINDISDQILHKYAVQASKVPISTDQLRNKTENEDNLILQQKTSYKIKKDSKKKYRKPSNQNLNRSLKDITKQFSKKCFFTENRKQNYFIQIKKQLRKSHQAINNQSKTIFNKFQNNINQKIQSPNYGIKTLKTPQYNSNIQEQSEIDQKLLLFGQNTILSASIKNQITQYLKKININSRNNATLRQQRKFIINQAIIKTFMKKLSENFEFMNYKHLYKNIYRKIKQQIVNYAINQNHYLANLQKITNYQNHNEQNYRNCKSRKTTCKKRFYSCKSKEEELIIEIEKMFNKAEGFIKTMLENHGLTKQKDSFEIIMKNISFNHPNTYNLNDLK